MWLSAIIKWNSSNFWKHKDNRSRKPWDRLPGSTVTDTIHNCTPHTRENQRHEKAAAQCCLTDGVTKVKEVKDSLYWAESLPPQGSAMPQSPWWGKEPHRFPLHPGFQPCDLLPRATDEQTRNEFWPHCSHTWLSSCMRWSFIEVGSSIPFLPHGLYHKLPKWRNLNLASKPKTLTLLT